MQVALSRARTIGGTMKIKAMRMRKINLLWSAVALVAIVAGCAKELDPSTGSGDVMGSGSVEGSVPFALRANEPATKTTVGEDWTVSWNNGDIIYAVTTDETWGVPYSKDNTTASIAEYTFDGNEFTTSKTIADGTYTFNFLYSNNTSKSYHRSDKSTFLLPNTQYLNCNTPKANLGKYDALAGQAADVTVPTEHLYASMHHLFAIMKVTLKNKTTQELTISTFELTASDKYLTGSYAINFGATPTVSENSMKSKTVTVSLTNCTLAAGTGEKDIYIVIPPFNNYSGDITFTATATNGAQFTKTNSVSGVNFEPGTYNSANFSLKGDVVEGNTLLYSTGFENSEGFTAGSDYTNTITTGPSGKQWEFYYGTPSATKSNLISGDQSVGLRLYYNKDPYGYAQMQFDVARADLVKYKAKASTSNGGLIRINTLYSTDSGNTWKTVESNKAIASTTTDYSFEFNGTNEETVRIKFEISTSSTKPTTSNVQLTIDDVKIYRRVATTGAAPAATVTTGAASNVTASGARLSGTVAGVTGTITAAGFKYGSAAGSLTSEVSATPSEGSFSANLTGLTAGSKVYYQAFVTVQGTGNQSSIQQTFTGSVQSFDNPVQTWLDSYEIPATSTYSITASNTLYNGFYCHSTVSEAFGTTKAAVYNTTNSNQKIVAHTFENGGKVLSNYTLLYDKNKVCALWVAYSFDSTDHTDQSVGRQAPSSWPYDPGLDESWQPNLKNGSYRADSQGQSYSRGHQCASEDRQTTVYENNMTFYASNMTPQNQSLNGGNWGTLELRVQTLGNACSSNEKLYVVTGPLFEVRRRHVKSEVKARGSTPELPLILSS